MFVQSACLLTARPLSLADLQPALNRLSKEGKWDEMGGLLDDEFLDTFGILCEDPAEIVPKFTERYGDLIDTWQCTVETGDRELQRAMVQSVQALAN